MSGYKVKSSLKLALGAELNRKKAENSEKAASSSANRSEASASSSSAGPLYFRRSKSSSTAPKTNKGISGRIAKDLASQPTSEEMTASHQRKTMLERKAEMYDRLQRGDHAGLSEAQRSSLGVDFDKKMIHDWDALQNGPQQQESASDEDSESDSDDEEPDEHKDRVEVLDDMGRTRYVKPSRAHKYSKPTSAEEPAPFTGNDEDTPDYNQAIYGEQTHFPVYEQTPEERQARQAALAEEPLFKHYDPSTEVRDASGARYTFSANEEERLAQQAAIKNARFEVDREVAEQKEKEGKEEEKVDKRTEELLARKRKLIEAREKKQAGSTSKKAKTDEDGTVPTQASGRGS